MNNRVEWLDIAKGLGIFCIVIGHNAVPQWLNDWVYSFHVPMFFIISGYFYRQRTLAETLAKGWRQLLRPMLLTILIAQLGLLFLFVRHGFWSGPSVVSWLVDVVSNMNTGHVFAMWFLGALFWGKLWMCLVGKLPEKVQYIASIVLFVAGYCLFRRHEAPWVFFRGMAVPSFLFVGQWLRQEFVIEREHKNWVLCLALLLVAIAWMFPVNISGFVLPYGIGSVMTAVAISIAVLVVLKKASEMSSVPSKLFLYAGQNSLIILCVHGLIHTWQIDRLLWEVLPPIGNVHFVLGLGIIALAECVILVVVVYFLQKIPVVRQFFHSK
ncbi:MAG: acyltransferase family protein [Bacteroidales bacterium]|nr:acyltransferase family protein [Bacteroidales bacterium]